MSKKSNDDDFQNYSKIIQNAKKLAKQLQISMDDAFILASEQQLDNDSSNSNNSPNTNSNNSSNNSQTISSDEWNSLLTLEDSLMREAIETLQKETLKYEEGSGNCPTIEYCIGLATDRRKEREPKLKKEREIREEKIKEFKEILEERRTERIEGKNIEISEEERKQKIRDSWTKNKKQ